MAKTARRVSLYIPIEYEEKLIELANELNEVNKERKKRDISKSGAGFMIIKAYFDNKSSISNDERRRV